MEKMTVREEINLSQIIITKLKTAHMEIIEPKDDITFQAVYASG